MSQSHVPSVSSVGVALADHPYSQAFLAEAIAQRWKGDSSTLRKLTRFHDAMSVQTRHMALSVPEYDAIKDFGAANDAYIRVGTELGGRAVTQALEAAGVSPGEVGSIFFTTVTGLATPTLDARLVNLLGLRSDIRRVPMFGLGCVGGAAGLARLCDHMHAFPEGVGVLLSVELCSLTIQNEMSVPNLIASGLFADGAAAVVVAGSARSGNHTTREATTQRSARVVASKSTFFPNTERVMGWDIGQNGFKIVLSADVPIIVHNQLPPAVDSFLKEQGLVRGDIPHWICHPGGPKVIDAIERALELEPNALSATRDSLSRVGNMSSASVLHVLSEKMRVASPGDRGLLLAMGPGFCAELVLLEW